MKAQSRRLWLVIGRGIRGFSHLRRHPSEILLLPLMTGGVRQRFSRPAFVVQPSPIQLRDDFAGRLVLAVAHPFSWRHDGSGFPDRLANRRELQKLV